MIYNIWIIDSSGLCMFHRSYGGFKTDPHLISGFFTAIYNFAREVGGDRLETISMQDTAFTFLVSKNILFVVASDDKTGSEGKELLKVIEKEFFKRFERRLFLFSDMLRGTPEVLAFQHFVDALVEKINAKPTVLLEIKLGKELKNIYPKRLCSIVELLKRGSRIREEIIRKFGLEGLDILSIADGTRSIAEISEIVGVLPSRTLEIMEYAREHGWLTMRSIGKAEISSIIESFLRGEINMREVGEKLSKVYGKKVDEETIMRLIEPAKRIEGSIKKGSPVTLRRRPVVKEETVSKIVILTAIMVLILLLILFSIKNVRI